MRLDGPPQPSPRHETLVAALHAAADHPSGVTFVGLDERETAFTWREVLARARRAAAALRAWGIAPGDRVALVLRTEPAFLDAFFGAWLAGAVPVPLYPPVRLGRLEEWIAATARMLEVSGAALVVSGGGTLRLLGEVEARARPRLGVREAAGLLARGAAAGAGDPGEGTAEAPRPSDLGLIQFSSGSTVAPKPVALTHAALAAQIDALVALVRPTPADALCSWLPLYHDMGLIGGLLAAASYPGRLVLIAPEHFLARPALWPRAIARHRTTVSAAPSFAYAYAAERVEPAALAGLDLGAWRLALCGAEPIAGEALRRFAARFAPHGLDPGALVPVYGLSEAALAVTFAPPGRPLAGLRLDAAALARSGTVAPGEREVMSVGTPIPGVAIEVRADREADEATAGDPGATLGPGQLGRIWVRGPSLFREYLGDPAATARALRDGWLDTGDLGFVQGGELFVHGRAKDLVIVRGANHAPEEFEEALHGLPGLRPGGAVAVGGADAAGGERLVILAERTRRPASPGAAPGPAEPDDDSGLQAQIRRALLERTGVEPGLVRLLAPGTLPRTSSGKLRRGEARRRLEAEALDAPAPVNAWRLALALLRGQLARWRARWLGRSAPAEVAQPR